MAQFKLRMPESLREAVEASARRSGNSLNTEIVQRLEASFRGDDQAGGPEVREIMRLWHAGFLRGIGLAARALGVSENDSAAVLRDVFGFRTAVHAANDAVMSAQPDVNFKQEVTPEQIKQYWELTDFFARASARGAPIKVSHGGDK